MKIEPVPGSAAGRLVVDAPLFGGHAPLLKYLDLDGLRLAWNSGFYCNLLTLKIVNCRADAHGYADRDIRYALRDSPNLEVLDLSLIGEGDAIPLLGSSLLASSRIKLKSLHTLILGLPVARSTECFFPLWLTLSRRSRSTSASTL